MPLVFLNDPTLYDDYEHFVKAFPSEIRSGSSLVIYHCLWDRRLTKHCELSLMSLLVSQAPPFEVWLWLTPEAVEHNCDITAALSSVPHVRVKTYMPEAESEGTVFSNHFHLLKGRTPAYTSDAFRLLVLYKYGGFYFDLDVLFLKDWRPLSKNEFFYQWAYQPFGNNAVLHFSKKSTNIYHLCKEGISRRNFSGPKLFTFLNPPALPDPVLVLPSFAFDPIWRCHDSNGKLNDYCNRFDDFFRSKINIPVSDFFKGCYAYHWHNRWHVSINPGTMVGCIYTEIVQRFHKRFRLNEHTTAFELVA